MPYVRLEVNVPLPDDVRDRVLSELSACVAAGTGKPEAVVQASVPGNVKMLMAKSSEPTAHLEIKGIDLQEAHAKGLSASICGLLSRELGIPGNRTYIAFASYAGGMWGFDGGTL
ncbi:MAG: hypothetical protein LBJ46_09605 [Planctomycetota bacterium]|nr:hypothetical protein [Planctomycetota bacterium]